LVDFSTFFIVFFCDFVDPVNFAIENNVVCKRDKKLKGESGLVQCFYHREIAAGLLLYIQLNFLRAGRGTEPSVYKWPCYGAKVPDRKDLVDHPQSYLFLGESESVQ